MCGLYIHLAILAKGEAEPSSIIFYFLEFVLMKFYREKEDDYNGRYF